MNPFRNKAFVPSSTLYLCYMIRNVETDWRDVFFPVLITTIVSLIVHLMPCTVHPPSINFYDDSCDGVLSVE